MSRPLLALAVIAAASVVGVWIQAVTHGASRPVPTQEPTALIRGHRDAPRGGDRESGGVTGRAIRKLHDGMLPPGQHVRVWDGLTTARLDAAPGVYLIRLRTSEGVRTQRIAVSR